MSDHAPGTPSWVDLSTPDVDASAAFYGGLFGWSAETDPGYTAAQAGGYRMFKLDGRSVAGLGPLQGDGQPPWWTTYVTVRLAEDTADRVQRAGGQVLLAPMDVLDVGRMAVFADPAGAVFAVWQPREHRGAEVVNEPGSLTWNELACRDPERAKAFYPEVFGWEPVEQPGGDVPYVEWQLDGRPVAGLMPMDDKWPDHVPDHWMVYFAVADCDATAERARELGGTVSVPPTDIPPGRFAVLDDPQGAVFSVIAPRVPSAA